MANTDRRARVFSSMSLVSAGVHLEFAKLVVCKFYAEALFCALASALFCAHLRSCVLICVFLCPIGFPEGPMIEKINPGWSRDIFNSGLKVSISLEFFNPRLKFTISLEKLSISLDMFNLA